MNESSPGVLEAEAPVNPYSLLDAVNRSSASANAAWLIYIGAMSYLLITVAGITHKDLLLNSDITLPILQVKIDLTRFFVFAPILLVVLHMGVISQLVLLSRKSFEFAAAIRMLETTDQRTHPLRLEIDNFFFLQAIAGPERSRVVGALLHAMTWLTLVLMPIGLLLYVQLVFLPYHDATITGLHRLAVLADIAVLVLVGIFLLRADTSIFRVFWRTAGRNPGSLAFAACVFASAAYFSLFAATIPRGPDHGDRGAAFASADGSLLGLFHRNLNVTDLDLVVDKDVTPGEPSLNLRGRDLRFARLDRTDLHQADLTGADLEGASLVGADLRGIFMSCADLSAMLLTDDRRASKCTSARGANFSRARLMDARMAGVDLTGARLEEAQLEGAQLGHAVLSGTNFASARLERVDLSAASLMGSNFLLASLQGADLSGTKLQLADFGSAAMQGANLSLASLEGANLRDADLEGANLHMSRLIGADLSGAKLQASDLSGALVWRTAPPSGEAAAFSDLAQIVMRQPGAEDLAALRAAYERLEDGALKTRLAEGLAPLTEAGPSAGWATSGELQVWQGLARPAEPGSAEGSKGRLTDYLIRLACRSRFANAAVATGIARRALAQGFKGEMPAIYERLRAADCPASAAISPRLMRELAAAADAARGQ